jgi:hypothetical protein
MEALKYLRFSNVAIKDKTMKYIELFLCLAFIIVAFYLGYFWAVKRLPSPSSEAEKKAILKTVAIAGNAKISDIRVETEAKILNKIAQKTDAKREALQTIREDLHEKSEYPAVFDQNERNAMADLIQAQDEELKACRALTVELIIARDQWRNAYLAARDENNIQRIAHEARLAAVRGEKIRIGAISVGVGFIGGMLVK